jgi:hypothetical protein
MILNPAKAVIVKVFFAFLKSVELKCVLRAKLAVPIGG